jgi:hypothetical protein
MWCFHEWNGNWRWTFVRNVWRKSKSSNKVSRNLKICLKKWKKIYKSYMGKENFGNHASWFHCAKHFTMSILNLLKSWIVFLVTIIHS